VGGSSGLIASVAVRVAQELNDPAAFMVCVLPDTGERYLSKVYNEEWLREHRLLEPDRLTARDILERKASDAPTLICVEPGNTVREALALITKHNISQLPVCAGDRCVGSVSEGTLMARIIEQPHVLEESVEGMMDAPFPVVELGTPMSGIGRLLTRQNPAVLVRENSHLTGIVTRYDMVTYLTQ
jgi:cystathionine beta-synthase